MRNTKHRFSGFCSFCNMHLAHLSKNFWQRYSRVAYFWVRHGLNVVHVWPTYCGHTENTLADTLPYNDYNALMSCTISPHRQTGVGEMGHSEELSEFKCGTIT